MENDSYTYYLGLGSNLGDRKRNLMEALGKLSARVGAVYTFSSPYDTEPWGFVSSHRFLNAACALHSPFTPMEVLKRTQEIEREMGRKNKSSDGAYQDRLIDIDLLLCFNGKQQPVIVDEPILQLPHPLMEQRGFVMDPLREILEPAHAAYLSTRAGTLPGSETPSAGNAVSGWKHEECTGQQGEDEVPFQPLEGTAPFWPVVIGTGLGSGYSPWAPGTAGALLATLLWWLCGLCVTPLEQLWITVAAILLATVAGIWATNRLEPYWGEDPKRVVVDEMVGIWISLLAAPTGHWGYMVAAFVLFRLFDIFKPLGVRKMEDLPQGIGVMMDDVLAGVYGFILLIVARWVTG